MVNRSLLSLLAVLLVLSSAPGARAAGDGGADIPGSDWSGSRASGFVGGAIYDKVWRLVLTEPRVALAQLEGAPGAELGLYLFDAATTSVLTGTPLKSSALPGGNQRVTAALPAGTYYINVNGRNPDRAYGFALTLALIVDPTPPFLTISAASGASRVSSPTVSVSLDASESLSGLEEMRLRIDGGEWSSWQPYAPVTSVVLDDREGEHSVEMQVANGAGLVSAIARDTIILDLTSPRGTLLSPTLSTLVRVNRPTIRYQFNEPLRRSTWNGAAITIQDTGGRKIRGVGSYDPTTMIGTFSVLEDLQPGVEYVVQEGNARDRAGNLISLNPWILAYRIRPRITFNQSAITAFGSSPVRVAFSATSLPVGTELLLECLVEGADGDEWESAGLARVEAGADVQRVTIQPLQSGVYKLRFIGSATRWPVSSGRLQVTLAPQLLVAGTLDTRRADADSVQSVAFRVFPAGVADLMLVLSRCNVRFTSCTVVERTPISPNSDGTVSYTWKPPAGNWTVRIRTPNTLLHREARSALVKFIVR